LSLTQLDCWRNGGRRMIVQVAGNHDVTGQDQHFDIVFVLDVQVTEFQVNVAGKINFHVILDAWC
jgi:hypothetical protein